MAEYKIISSIQDSNVTTYTAHKNWSFTSQSFTDSRFKYLRGIYSNKYVTISASSAIGELQNSDGSYMKNTYIGINHLYYSYYPNFGYISYPVSSFTRNLNKELITYSVPRIKTGDEIKPGSLSLTVTGRVNETITLRDNGNYELIDTRINTSSFAPGSLIYLGFNNGFDSSYIPDNYYSKDISYTTGINSSNYTHGYQANFNGSSSYIQVKDDLDNWFNTFDNDFAISFWINAQNYSINNQSVISKKWLNGTLLQAYPFDIRFDGLLGQLTFTRTDGVNVAFVSGTASNHIVFQKTGSNIECYIDGTFNSTDSTNITGKVSNKRSI